ncbi:MAG: tRNA pseudouridine(55) synthase TruB [Phaeodactylibacter sp.]|uniref:tRNA pseudouridine(55) synthase TruB n=1 Tax=Phaeodactylibacter sp. TaxID=1940289 RepID=UPI0032EDDE2F
MDGDDQPVPRYDFKAGTTLLVDKPQGWTSFDVVNKVRYKIKHRLKVKKIKVGHSGTLDPMATGLLILCTGKFTKTLHQLQGLSKAYTGTMYLGATTPSYDAESEVQDRFPTAHITPELIEQARQQFLGKIQQVPPMFSAIKVDGQPLYKKARKGETVEIEPREVEIFDFKITRIDLPEIDFEVSCSKGTYIRSLAHDFGKALNSGAYLTALRRTKVGDFDIQDAWSLDQLVEFIEEGPVIGAEKMA